MFGTINKGKRAQAFSVFFGLGVLVSITGFVVSPLGSVPADAADFESGSSVTVDQSKENLYVSGSQVTVNSDTQKDLVVAGSTVNVDGNVERNLIGAAGQLSVKSKTIGGTARVAGGDVVLEGVTIDEDLVVAGGTVTITNSTIKGDLAVSTGTLKITGSKIGGDAYVSYSSYSGDDLDNAVAGKLELKENKDTTQKADKGAALAFALGYGFRGQFAIIIATLLLIWFLGSRNRLTIPTIKFDTKMLIDFAIALAVYIVSAIVLALTLVFAFIPYLGTIALTPALGTGFGIIILLATFSKLFFGIYLGNLLKNTFNLSITTSNAILIGLIIWIVLELLALIPVVGFLIALLIWVFMMANTGFVLRNVYAAINNHLKPYGDGSKSMTTVERKAK